MIGELYLYLKTVKAICGLVRVVRHSLNLIERPVRLHTINTIGINREALAPIPFPVFTRILKETYGLEQVKEAYAGLTTLQKHLRHILKNKALPGNSVFSILEDNEGYLWLGTNNGLSKFSPGKKIFTSYDVTDGLQSNMLLPSILKLLLSKAKMVLYILVVIMASMHLTLLIFTLILMCPL